MKCKKCGQTIDNNSKVCTYCGAKQHHKLLIVQWIVCVVFILAGIGLISGSAAGILYILFGIVVCPLFPKVFKKISKKDLKLSVRVIIGVVCLFLAGTIYGAGNSSDEGIQPANVEETTITMLTSTDTDIVTTFTTELTTQATVVTTKVTTSTTELTTQATVAATKVTTFTTELTTQATTSAVTVTAEKLTNPPETVPVTNSYVLNTSTMKFHKSICRDVDKIAEENYFIFEGTRDEVIAMGYDPCGHCNP